MDKQYKKTLISELKNELNELTEKINNLRLYLDSPQPNECLPDRTEDWWLLEGQFRAMLTYQAYLFERLSYLRGENDGD